MPFHDLNIAYTADHAAISNTLLFAKELGYETVALSVAVTGKLPPQPPIIPVADIAKTDGVQILTRLTLTISDTTQNHRLSSLNPQYDIVALRPTNDKTLQHCCSSLECDLISIDLSQRLSYPLKFKTVASALQRGIRFEICYSVGIVTGADARRNLISGATQLIRATRGRGIILSSEARSALGLRAPWDVINLAQVWSLSQQRAREALCEEAAKVVRFAGIKRTSHRGVVDIIDGGAQVSAVTKEKRPEVLEKAGISKGVQNSGMAPSEKELNVTVQSDGPKRKASQSLLKAIQPTDQADGKVVSKREMKRQAKRARLEGQSIVSRDGTNNKTTSLPLQHESLMPRGSR